MDWKAILIIYACIHNVLAANILILPHLQGSHVAENMAVGETLLKRGHKVYTIMPDASHQVEKVRKRGINVITFEVKPGELYMDSPDYEDHLARDVFQETESIGVIETIDVTTTHCRRILENTSLIEEVQQINPDIALVDPFPLNYCHFLLPYNLSIPYGCLFSTTNFWDIGIPALPSVVPPVLMKVPEHMTFMDRVKSLMFYIVVNSDYNFFFQHFPKDLRDTFAPSITSWHDFMKDVLFYAATRDELLEMPYPRMPHLVAVPGITYSTPKTLPEELDSLVTAAEDGVILMSFGSSGGLLPRPIFDIFVKAFGMLKSYQILWKFPSRHLKSKDIRQMPPNIHLLSWLPQNDILGHPKTKVFLTHCGNNGIHESLYHGVPMIGFPLFAEQPHNADQLQRKGFGVALDIHSVTPKELYEAILNVTSSRKIIDSVRKASSMLKTRRLHPKEEISDMMENIMKFGGQHLHSVAVSLPWYQLFMIDILFCMLIIMMCCGLVIFCSCRVLCYFLCHQTKVKSE